MTRSATRPAGERVSPWFRGLSDGRQLPETAGSYRELTRRTPDRITAGQGLFALIVAGVGFEPT